MENSTNNENKKIEWGGWLNEFLWICAGANRPVLRQCPTEYAKYAGIGGTILFTALMAMLSGGYALYFVFGSTFKAVLFGIFWGLLIFNLDRFIVNTMYSDGKVTISWQEFTSGLPRIIMAIFLGIVISTPLEMKIFEDRIDSQIVKDNGVRQNQTAAVYQEGSAPLEKQLQDLKMERGKRNIERQSLDNKRNEFEAEKNKAEKALRDEGEGSALSKKAGRGPIYREKEEYLKRVTASLNKWENDNKGNYREIESDIKSLNVKIESLEKILEERRIKTDGDISNSMENNGFCVRYEAFSHLKEESTSLNIVSIVVMLLFIIIETAPTFFKMMIASGPYDDYLRAEMHRVRIFSEKRISDLNDIVNTEVQISTQKNKERLEAELLANKELMERISSVQAELLQTAIDKWREEELAKIEKDPSIYIKQEEHT